MSDIQTMTEMLTGLKAKKTRIEADEKVFLKVSGLNEEIEKAAQERDDYKEDLQAKKLGLKDLKSKKSTAVAETTKAIEAKVNAILPFGTAVFSYSADENDKYNLVIGWKNGNIVTPYNGLSGGEKQIFDAALANVLDADIIVVEAAELDKENLEKSLIELAKLDKKVIVNTWAEIDFDLPEPFVKVEV